MMQSRFDVGPILRAVQYRSRMHPVIAVVWKMTAADLNPLAERSRLDCAGCRGGGGDGRWVEGEEREGGTSMPPPPGASLFFFFSTSPEWLTDRGVEMRSFDS